MKFWRLTESIDFEGHVIRPRRHKIANHTIGAERNLSERMLSAIKRNYADNNVILFATPALAVAFCC